MSNDHVRDMLRGLQIHIEQLAAEMKDPDTTPARREKITAELRQWYEMLKEHA